MAACRGVEPQRHVEEPPQHASSDLLEGRSVGLRHLYVDRQMGSEIGGQIAVQLDVELQPVGRPPDAEGLVGVAVAGGEVNSSPRQREGVVVPVEDR